MYSSLNLFQTASAMARHAGTRQAIVARNVANADTPDYKAQHVGAFKDAYDGMAAGEVRTTRPGHMASGTPQIARALVTTPDGEPSPNGNTVSIEDEMLNSVAVSREHSRALTIYRHAMTVLRTSLGRS